MAAVFGIVLFVAFLLLLLTMKASEGPEELSLIWTLFFLFPFGYAFFGAYVGRGRTAETYAEWVRRPHSRVRLVAAKWTAAWAKAFAATAAAYAGCSLYALFLSRFLSGLSPSDGMAVLAEGLRWAGIMIGFSPVLLATGIYYGCSIRSGRHRKPSTLLWTAVFGVPALLYPAAGDRLIAAVKGWPAGTGWRLLAIMAATWLAAGAALRLAAAAAGHAERD